MKHERPKARRFTDLIVWQKAHAFVLTVYRQTAAFPREEIYGLTSQFRRAAVSIAANIAEGFRKRSNAEKSRFYEFSQSSLEECRYYLILAGDLRYADMRNSTVQLEEVSKLLAAYRGSLTSERKPSY